MKSTRDNLFRIKGTIEKIFFRNDDTGYKILKLIDKDGDELSCKGVIPFVEEGNLIEVFGDLIEDDFGNPLLTVKFVEPVNHDNTEVLYTYLAGKNIKHIGEKTAEKIIETFGKDSHRILMADPEKLSQIPGISRKKAEEIVKQYSESSFQIETYSFLAKLSITQKFIYKIIKVFKESTIEEVKKNPYQLANKIRGIGFKKADDIAMNMGISKDSLYRKQAAVIHILQEAMSNGDTMLPDDTVYERMNRILDMTVDYKEYREIIQELYFDDVLTLEINEYDNSRINIYLSYMYKKEIQVSQKIRKMVGRIDVDQESLIMKIDKIGKKFGIKLDDTQLEAILKGITNNFVVITGGPGTGKTTLINVILEYYDNKGNSVNLAAPTACAAKRMEAVTGHSASTIHRLLEIQPIESEEDDSFGRNKNNLLDCDVLIVDETSMVDLTLFSALLDACSEDTHIILVGDMNQLPSVAAGNVLHDIIKSEVVPVIFLNKIYRQGNRESQIVKIANNVLNGEKVSIDNSADSDLYFIKFDENNFKRQLISTINRVENRFGIKKDDIQILIPQKSTNYGVENINKLLQTELNTEEKSVYILDKMFKLRDKVIHIKNNYMKDVIELENMSQSKGVFNGDVGYVTEINDRKSFTVRYDDKTTTYTGIEVNEIDLSYAITVHKSQGSEYPAVIIILKGVPYNLRMRTLLYTAITRAKKIAIIIGDASVFSDMVKNVSKIERYTGLKEKIRDAYGVVKEGS